MLFVWCFDWFGLKWFVDFNFYLLVLVCFVVLFVGFKRVYWLLSLFCCIWFVLVGLSFGGVFILVAR